MKFLANENFPFPSIKVLRENGFEVLSITEHSPGVSDKEILDKAQKENFIILTFDRDYGELIFRYNPINPPAVVYFRFKGVAPDFAGNFLLNLINQDKITVTDNFTVIEESNVRQRKYN